MAGADPDYQLARLHLEPGDILVVKIHDQIQDEAHIERIRANAKLLFGDACPAILVLDANVDLSILTRTEIESRSA